MVVVCGVGGVVVVLVVEWWGGGVVLVVCGSDVILDERVYPCPPVCASNSGGPCPCGHDLPGPAPVCRALKSSPINSSPR